MTTDPVEITTRTSRLAPVRRIAGRNRTKADIVVYSEAGETIAVKDYSPRPWWIRNTLGRFLVRREVAAYRHADGLTGIPRFAGRRGPFALATGWLDARPLAAFADGSVPTARFDRLREILASLHDRGVAVADLNYRDVLLADDGSVHVIDFAAAWTLGRRPGPLRRKLFERLRAADLFALARLRARFSGEDADAVVAATDDEVLAWHRRARRIKWCWDRLRRAERLPPVNDHWRF
jgi:hypothetical protein